MKFSDTDKRQLLTIVRTIIFVTSFVYGIVNPSNFNGLEIYIVILAAASGFFYHQKENILADIFNGIMMVLALMTVLNCTDTQPIPDTYTATTELKPAYTDLKVPSYGTVLIRNVFSAEEKAIIATVATKYADRKGFIEILNIGSEGHKPTQGYPFCDMQTVIAGLDGFDAKNFLKESLPSYPYICDRLDINKTSEIIPSTNAELKVLPYSESITLIRDLTSAANNCFKAKVALTALDLDKDITFDSAKNLRSIVMTCEKDKLNTEINKIK